MGGVDGKSISPLSFLVLERKEKKLGRGIFLAAIFLVRLVVSFPGPMKSYPVKRNHTSLAVRKILWYRQKESRHPVTL